MIPSTAEISCIVVMNLSSRDDLPQNLQQRRGGDRLSEEVDRPGGSCPALLLVAGPAADEDDRNLKLACGDLTLYLEAVHVGHADVEHEARGSRRLRRPQELLS